MRTKAPGKSFRKGISLKQILRLFPDNATAEQWFIEQRWEDGMCCPRCGSVNVQTGAKHPTIPFRCREKDCGKFFSAKTGTVMEGSKIGYQDWINLVHQSYQPSKVELDVDLRIKGTFKQAIQALLRPVRIRRVRSKPRP